MKELILNVGNFKLICNDATRRYGHDDSFPYTLSFTIAHNTSCVDGIAYNDGWGGDANITLEQGESESKENLINELFKSFEKEVENHNYFIKLVDGIRSSYPIDVRYLFDCIGWYILEGHNAETIMDIDKFAEDHMSFDASIS